MIPKESYLPLISEEAAEVIQAVCKVQRFGSTDNYTGQDAIEYLYMEIGDLLEVIDQAGLDWERLEHYKAKKREKLKFFGPDGEYLNGQD